MPRELIVSPAIFARLSAFWRKVGCPSLFCFNANDILVSNALDLIDYGREPKELDYAYMIQSFQRFLFEHLVAEGNDPRSNPVVVKGSSYEYNQQNPVPPPITQLVGIDAKNVVTCLHCKTSKSKDNMTHIVDLIYPRTVCILDTFEPHHLTCPPQILPNDTVPYSDFPTILRNSLLRKMTHKATCQTCGKNFSNFSTRREIATRDLPSTLAVNACVNTDDNFKYWFDHRNQTFLKPQIALHGEVDDVEDPEAAIYQLRVSFVKIYEA